jgi:LPS export ABC transporter protein LptC
LSVAASLLLLPALIIGCGDEGTDNKAPQEVITGAIRPHQVTQNAHFYLSSGGQKTTELTADEVWQFTRHDSTIAFNLYVEFYDSTGERVSTLTSDEGYIREKDNYMAVSGSVIVIGKDSVRLETEYLVWDGQKDSVVTDSFVTVIEGSGDSLMSYGFQSDPELKVSGRLTDVEKIKDGND